MIITIPGGGTGSGTVTNTGGALTANAVVLGASGADTKVSTGITTNGVSELDLGVVGANGVLGLNGLTSGKATLTAPAVAGTITNAITSSNVLNLPSGSVSAAAVQIGAANTGFYSAGAGNLEAASSGATIFTFASASSIRMASGIALGWTASASSDNAADTGLSRSAADVLAAGNGTAGDESGLIRSANGGKVTGDITLTVNTAITIFSFSLPAVAKAWGWQAVIPWIISAGSGTNTISIGVNYTQTPTGTTGMCGEILTSNANAGSQAFVPLSATGATNILTSGTITPGASLFQASCSGTLLASATAGTFTITMTAAGTTATALAKAGATCWFY